MHNLNALLRLSRKGSGRVIAPIATLLLFAVSVFAQTAGYGNITGVVQDSSGAVVAGARVVLENTDKGIRRELNSNNAGLFSFPNLVPAAGYHVTITKQGFTTYDAKNVTVSVGETVNLNADLKVGGTGTAVEVTSEAPLVDQTKTDVSQVIGSSQIQDLPINGRRVDNFVLLTPGVTTDGPFGLISFRGNPGGNSFLTDGNDTTNQFYDENAGRTRTTNISQDAVQEFQVVSSNFLAEFGRASGGVINTVTRSGGNNIHGTLYEFFRNRTLNATDVTANGVNPPEWRHQAGASVGGPIVKDKLFYFFNGELQRRNAPIVSSNINNRIFDANGVYRTVDPTSNKPNCASGGVGQPTLAQCQAAIDFIQNRAETQLVRRNMDTNLLFGKIDFRPNEKDSFSISANYLDFRSPNGIQTQVSLTGGNGIGNNADTNVFNRTGRVSWTRIISPNVLNELRYGFFKDRQYDPASPSLLPSTGPVTLTVQSVSNIGYPNGYPRLNPSEVRNQVADTLSWNVGKHSFKFGVDYAHVEDYVNRLANRFGTYTYATLQNFALDFSGNSATTCGTIAAPKCHWQSYSQAFGNPIVDTKMSDYALFVQDTWKVTPKLTISPGLRFEYTWIPQPGISNPKVFETSRIPYAPHEFAPRFGIAYQLSEKTVLRAGYGIFYNRYPSSTIENLFLTNGVYQASYSLRSNTQSNLTAGPIFPAPLSSAPTAVAGTSTILISDSKFRNPYSQQLTAGFEQEVAKNTSLTLSYVWSRGLHLLQTKDANLKDPNFNCPKTLGVTNKSTPNECYGFPILDASGAQVGAYYTPIYNSTLRINSAFGSINELQSVGNSWYNGLLVQLNRRYSTWFQGSISYTWSHNIDYNQGGGGNTLFGSTFPTSVFNGDYAGERGNSSIDQRHRFVANAVFSPTFLHSNSVMARYLVNNWQLSAVELAATSQALPPTISVSDGAPGVLSFFSLNGLGGSGRVPFESTSALKIGNIYRTDARLAKQLPFGERYKAYLMFEAFNIFNHVIPGGPGPRDALQYTSIMQTSGALNGIIALKPNATYGTLLQTQAPPDGTTARRAQVAFRLTF
jgi:hypothetical protein